MTTSLKADALNGLQLVNYSSLGLLYPRWCSVSPLADKREQIETSRSQIGWRVREEGWNGSLFWDK